jgi:acetyl esterase
MGLDSEVEAALPRFFGTADPPSADPVAASRRRLEALAAHGPDSRGELPTRDLLIPGLGGLDIPARVYTPEWAGGPMLVFFHGGGWISGSIESHDRFCRAFAERLGTVVVSVGYRLAPEHRFPAAVQDAWLATKWLSDDPESLGGAVSGLVVGGDSAGGTLATVVARRARDAGLELAGQMLIYPVVDAPGGGGSYERYASGYGLTRAAMEYQWQTYMDGADADDPDASPLRCRDLSGLAPAVVVTAQYDILRDEAEEYARRMRDAGVVVLARRYDGLVHGFLRIAGEVRVARAAFEDLVGLAAAAFGYGER